MEGPASTQSHEQLGPGLRKALRGRLAVVPSLGTGPLPRGDKRTAGWHSGGENLSWAPAVPGWAELLRRAGAEQRSEMDLSPITSSAPKPCALLFQPRSTGQKLSKTLNVSKRLYFALCLNDRLAVCGILGSQLLAFSTLKVLFHCLLASVVADEMLIVKSIIGPL